jgi:glycosyltransferase involved in cell wall biosynthesis
MSEGVSENFTLAIFTEVPVCCQDDRIFIHFSFGLIVDALARRYKNVVLCAPTSYDIDVFRKRGRATEYCLMMDNIELIPKPLYYNALSASHYPIAITKAYIKTLKKSKFIFIRGMPAFAGLLYFLAFVFHQRPTHWIVENPITISKSHVSSNWRKYFLSLVYAYQDRFFNRMGRWLTKGAFICNGEELGRIFHSPRTSVIVSSTVLEKDFFIREDTCLGEIIRLLFVGFVRPEKGIEYLIDALPLLKIKKQWRLTIVGSWGTIQDYKIKLDSLIAFRKIADFINWEGYISYFTGDLLKYYRSHDILILPSLSEGTPRVLIEARSNSLPVIATKVGGIPTSVKDGFDGILVPPKDSNSIASAIDRVEGDDELRRNLIRHGLETARKYTINNFIDTVIHASEEKR